MTYKRLPYYWPFVKGIHQPPVMFERLYTFEYAEQPKACSKPGINMKHYVL